MEVYIYTDKNDDHDHDDSSVDELYIESGENLVWLMSRLVVNHLGIAHVLSHHYTDYYIYETN